MNNPWLLLIYGVATLYFGMLTLRILPTLLKFLVALLAGTVKWPGPRIHNPAQTASRVRLGHGIGYQQLFPTFIWNFMVVSAVFIFSLLLFFGFTPFSSDIIFIKLGYELFLMTFITFLGGIMSLRPAQRTTAQMNVMLLDLANEVEPRAVDGETAGSEYAIEHPLIGHKLLSSDKKRAMDLYYESVRYHQDGNEPKAHTYYQEALRIHPSLHQDARETLSELAQDCTPGEAGAIYYWSGIHSENLSDWRQAASAYEKALKAYNQTGYHNRMSKIHCNLGNVKMQMGDPSSMKEFDKAIALNPRNGTAHMNIARLYYRYSYPGDPGFDRALDAFADAIIADPQLYGPWVISSLREIGYTWKEDLEEITRRVENKRQKSDSPS